MLLLFFGSNVVYHSHVCWAFWSSKLLVTLGWGFRLSIWWASGLALTTFSNPDWNWSAAWRCHNVFPRPFTMKVVLFTVANDSCLKPCSSLSWVVLLTNHPWAPTLTIFLFLITKTILPNIFELHFLVSPSPGVYFLGPEIYWDSKKILLGVTITSGPRDDDKKGDTIWVWSLA